MEKEVLDHGKVALVDKMGDDYSVLRAARVSTGSGVSKGEKKDKGLIDYLYRNKHFSPFSFVSFQFYVKCPYFVARQWMRHRTMDYNEVSARYKELEWETWFPDAIRVQDTENKQGSYEDSSQERLLVDSEFSIAYAESEISYRNLLKKGVAREQSRAVVPMGQYTEFFVHVNLRNLFNFLTLRLDEHAQKEIRVYAEAILQILRSIDEIKWSLEAFEKYDRLEKLYLEALNVSKKKHKSEKPLEDYIESFIRLNNKGE